jgi:SMODS and SLOG-associating 2TM effector domain
MSPPTSSKAPPVKATNTQSHPEPAGPTPAHQPKRPSSYPDEKSQPFAGVEPVDDSANHVPNTPLNIFRSALGVPPPKKVKEKPNSSEEDKPKLTPKNVGVYKKVLSCERTAHWKYLLCDFSVTIAMFLQIIVGASVTAFGAGNSSHVLITCFGAANTALASLLAVLKSQGLPNRIRQDWNQWRELREFIEQQEREFEMIVSGRVQGVEELNEERVWTTIKAIEAKYADVRLTNEVNRPDTYIKLPVPPILPILPK